MKTLIDRFNEIEKDYFNIKVGDIQAWPLIREYVFFELKRRLNKTAKPHMSDTSLPLLSKIWYILLIAINTARFVFTKKEESKYLVLSHPRKKLLNKSFIDIYTDPILDDMDDFVVFERLFQLKHLKPSHRKEILYAELFDFWPRFFSFFMKSQLNPSEKKGWIELEDKIEGEFGIKIEIINRIDKEIKRVRLTQKGLKKFLSNINPQLIIEVVGYYRLCKHINIVASELGIPTIELQHGYISTNHIAYNYPMLDLEISSFPTHIGIWSDYFKSQIKVPISDENVTVTGFKYFENQRRNSPSKISSRKILFISQGNIGKELSEVALSLSRISDLEIIYKLHPSEVSIANERYSRLFNMDNITVDQEIESDLYKHILESRVVVGVNSTALLEAVGLGRDLIVVKLKGWENFKMLIDDPKLPIHVCNGTGESLYSMLEKVFVSVSEKTMNKSLINDSDTSFLNIDKKSIKTLL